MRLTSVTKGRWYRLGDHFAGNRLGHLLDFGNGNFDGPFDIQEREVQDNGNRRLAEMAQVVEATYSDGMLRPDAPLDLHESQRVRLTIEPLSSLDGPKRSEALARLKEGIRSMNFRSGGPLPSRDELHDRD
jgi:predicted DNA-binding antitoxin AbrB/MazE fold protein